MRLTCPKCGAEYEVPDTVIPSEGLTVECSSCDSHWFQPGNASGEVGSDPMPQRQELDPAIADILREEARIEAELRAAEAANGAGPAAAKPKGPSKPSNEDKIAQQAAPSAANPPPVDPVATSSAPRAAPVTGITGRFATGFVVSIFGVLALLLIYANAPQIAQRMPGADPLLSNFVAKVDQARTWLDQAVRSTPAE